LLPEKASASETFFSSLHAQRPWGLFVCLPYPLTREGSSFSEQFLEEILPFFFLSSTGNSPFLAVWKQLSDVTRGVSLFPLFTLHSRLFLSGPRTSRSREVLLYKLLAVFLFFFSLEGYPPPPFFSPAILPGLPLSAHEKCFLLLFRPERALFKTHRRFFPPPPSPIR